MLFTAVDELSANPKIRRLLDRNLVGDATGTIALSLWTLAGTVSRGSMSDGVVSRSDTIRIMLSHEWAEIGSSCLVEVGLWHDQRTEQSCERCLQHLEDCKLCRPLGPGEFRFHDWWQRGYDHGAQTKLKIAKARELKDKALRAQVWARDCLPGDPEIAPCRYCSRAMRKQDRKSERRPEMEHVDPWLACGASNLAMSCWTCNRSKGQRTPEEAGMALQPPPARIETATRAQADSHPTGSAGSPQLGFPHPHGSAGSPASHSFPHPEGSAGSRITVPIPAPGPQTVDEEVDVPSPAKVDERRPSPSTVAARAPRPQPPGPDQSHPGPLIPAQIRDEPLSSYAHAYEGGSGDVPGLGAGSGPGEGPGPGGGAGRRRRRRGRGSGKPSSGQGKSSGAGSVARGRAGSVPPVDYMKIPGREGSPFRNYHGPWLDRDEQSMCERHGLDRPCRKCDEETTR